MDKGGRSTRFNMRVPPRWMASVRAEAQRIGISMADYVIMVVNERLDGASGMRGVSSASTPANGTAAGTAARTASQVAL